MKLYSIILCWQTAVLFNLARRKKRKAESSELASCVLAHDELLSTLEFEAGKERQGDRFVDVQKVNCMNKWVRFQGWHVCAPYAIAALKSVPAFFLGYTTCSVITLNLNFKFVSLITT